MLKTNLKHLETDADIKEILDNNNNAMICCGRMGPMCIPVYKIMENLESEYPDIAFSDMEFDIPAANFIKGLPECAGFMGLPFTVYFKNGKAVAATTSIQNEEQIREILEKKFTAAATPPGSRRPWSSALTIGSRDRPESSSCRCRA